MPLEPTKELEKENVLQDLAGLFLVAEGFWSIMGKEQVTNKFYKPATAGRLIRILIGIDLMRDETD